ncbi:hypothetical protein [Wolbachia endosymbiont (group A) of Scambus nigricans]|nr:hypothetical protein [Wolbachia endosymbiont (group A) of Scambus nigricans]
MRQLHEFTINHHLIKYDATKPSQCLGTGMTPFWMETSVRYSDDTFFYL